MVYFSRIHHIVARLALVVALLASCCGVSVAQSQSASEVKRLLVVTSFNSDVGSVSVVLRSFAEECERRRLPVEIVSESLGCDKFSDVCLWKQSFLRILNAYSGAENRPQLILILGQEAMSAYLSLDITKLPDVPVVCGMVSRNYIEIPDSVRNSQSWLPESRDILEVNRLYNVVGGCFYQYDIEQNLSLIKHFFPAVNHIALLTDNSYGGVSIRAYVADNVNRFPDFKFSWLDGRNLTILSATDSIAALPSDSTAVLIGTWRFDRSNRFYLNSSMVVMRQGNPQIPVFTLSATGIQEWAIGAYSPDYHNVGPELAEVVGNYLATGKSQMSFIPSKYVFNYSQLEHFDISEDQLPPKSIVVARPEGLFALYRVHIIVAIVVFLLLIIGLAYAVYQNARIRNLMNSLRKSQDEIIAAKNKAEANSLLKTSFLADMSHEIRTPLNAIVGFSQVIVSQDDSLTHADKANIVEIINRNCTQLTGLLNSILDISRIESGRARYLLEELELVKICQDILSSVQISSSVNDLAFNFISDLDSCIFVTDKQRFQQVLINLLSNSVKFTQKGGVTLSLQRGGVCGDDGITVSVTDTGIGIPADRAEDVFARFVKLDEYATGTGLGLSLCRMIVESFGGRIWVDTTYTSGARIVFALPCHSVSDVLNQ